MIKFKELRNYSTIHKILAKKDEQFLSIVERALWNFIKKSNKPASIIHDEKGGPYLLRVYLTHAKRHLGLESRDKPRRMPAPFLHFFFTSDEDREHHNHPFLWGISLILTGGYSEERVAADGRLEVKTYKPWSLNFIRRNTFHKVTLLEPENGCWTLFLSGPRVNLPYDDSWGFKDYISGKFETYGQRNARREAERKEQKELTERLTRGYQAETFFKNPGSPFFD